MLTVNCKVCGKSTEAYPSQAKRKKYCSKTCYARALSEKMKGAGHFLFGKTHSEATREKLRNRPVKRGPDNPRWKGYFLSRGYKLIHLETLSPEEQELFRPMATMTNKTYIPEHRVVMARHLGRSLLPTEVVHHVNGKKADNRLENLELHDGSAHKKEHWDLFKELQRLRCLLESRTCPCCGTSISSLQDLK